MSRGQNDQKSIPLRGDRLRLLREQRGWPQRELARRAGLSSGQIGKYEAGLIDPTSANLLMLAQLLNVSVDYLLGTTDEVRGHYGSQVLDDDEQAIINAYRRESWPGLMHFIADKIAK